MCISTRPLARRFSVACAQWHPSAVANSLSPRMPAGVARRHGTDRYSLILQETPPVQTRRQVQDLRSALHRLSSTDLLRADHVGVVLYLEDDSDARLLREWASLLGHPAMRFSSSLTSLRWVGPVNWGSQADIFRRVAFPTLHGLCLHRDRSAGPEAQDFPSGLRLLRWNRYEISNT